MHYLPLVSLPLQLVRKPGTSAGKEARPRGPRGPREPRAGGTGPSPPRSAATSLRVHAVAGTTIKIITYITVTLRANLHTTPARAGMAHETPDIIFVLSNNITFTFKIDETQHEQNCWFILKLCSQWVTTSESSCFIHLCLLPFHVLTFDKKNYI